MVRPLREIFPDVPTITVVDVGASPIDGDPPYKPLFDQGLAEVIGFEPSPEMFEELEAMNLPNATFLPYALGDGSRRTLHVCQAPGMTSLLEPDLEVLSHFFKFDEWGMVIQELPVETRRLDDIEEVKGADYFKLDVQGAELDVLCHGRNRIREALVVHTEVQFVPFYKRQPLFAELDQELRGQGFAFHRFLFLHSRTFKPTMVNNDVYAGLSQQLWSDAVYVRDFRTFGALSTNALMKIALILNDLYGSIDLAAHALNAADGQEADASNRYQTYLRGLNDQTQQ